MNKSNLYFPRLWKSCSPRIMKTASFSRETKAHTPKTNKQIQKNKSRSMQQWCFCEAHHFGIKSHKVKYFH